MDKSQIDTVKHATFALLDYCQKENWAGYDPYDALNSRLFAATPFCKSKYCRIALTQLLKRLPINIRPLLLIDKEKNPKALALFLMAFVKLNKLGHLPDDSLIRTMVDGLIALHSPNEDYWCWGYSFPWQGRDILVPRGAPNLVCTVFVANALLDLHESIISNQQADPNTQHPTPHTQYLDMALSAAEYIFSLYWEDEKAVGFSYPLPSVHARVHNANFLAAALFSRIYKLSGNEKFLQAGLNAARYSASKQNDDGSWFYGELPTQHWIDNFHTGYNLCALNTIRESAGVTEFDDNLSDGFAFYLDNFFEPGGICKYFHNHTYPIDIHCMAQSIITLTALDKRRGNLSLILSAFGWTYSNMSNGSGYFFYQRFASFANKVSYMRWSQAWMLLALSTVVEAMEQG